MEMQKYHALGNDYLVIDPKHHAAPFSQAEIARICHRNLGVGSDGILWGPLPSSEANFGLRIFNPDGSEAQKSGNGLRIFCRYLFDCGLVQEESAFKVETQGGVVSAKVHAGGRSVTVEMGRVSFNSASLPMAGLARDALNESLNVDGQMLTVCCASIGNPHCVVVAGAPVSAGSAHRFGPLIERHANFPERTNVQFLEIIDRSNIRIEIWERGAGYTLASGSSSSACAAVARRLGLVEPEVTVHMPGGQLSISVQDDSSIIMRGPVTRVATMVSQTEMFG